MAVRDIFKVSRKTFLNPSGWIDLNALIAQNKTIWAAIKGLFTISKPERTESFEEAVERLGLTDADVLSAANSYRWYALMLAGFALLSFAYGFFLLFRYGTLLGFLLSLGVTGLFLAQGFKYDFWSFQMRRRQLGLTFSEWKRSWLGE